MIGIIGSGKSSWAKMKAGSNYMTSIVSKDDIREMMAGEYYFDELLEPLIDKVQLQIIDNILESGRDVIIDECHLTVSERRGLIRTIRDLGYDPLTIVGILCPSKFNNVKRRMNDPKGQSEYVWRQVYNRMIKEFESPTNEEFDQLIVVNDDLIKWGEKC
jgi:predicted kinase